MTTYPKNNRTGFWNVVGLGVTGPTCVSGARGGVRKWVVCRMDAHSMLGQEVSLDVLGSMWRAGPERGRHEPLLAPFAVRSCYARKSGMTEHGSTLHCKEGGAMRLETLVQGHSGEWRTGVVGLLKPRS